MLYVDGDNPQFVDDERVTVSLEFSCDGAATHRCAACGEDLVSTVDSYEGESSGCVCTEYAPDDWGEEPSDGGPHDARRLPLSWVNSAAITADEESDSVTVSISVGDPRGAFSFTIRRIPDDAGADVAGRLVLHAPYPGEPLPHERLTTLAPGAFNIG
jgi:hypothetical protein